MAANLMPVQVRELLDSQVAVARDSARMLRPAIESSMKAEKRLTIDLTGIEVLSPSFVDELFGLLATLLAESGRSALLANSAVDVGRYEALGRTYRLMLKSRGRVGWELSPKKRTSRGIGR